MYLLSHNKIAEYLLLTVLLLVYAATVFASDSAKNAEYVGREVCTNCHEEQVGLWQGSHHDLAMQHADENSVRGDFSNIAFTHAGITSKFFKNNKKFMVRTDGADGKLHDFEIKYTFGVTPLQQYLVELEGGRLQALSIAWDTREKSAGGQRWFHLYPDEKVTHTDELHWTRYLANWNGMCAECHSTNLQKNYDSQSDNFKTSWSEINVSCEACHGPASNHLIWAHPDLRTAGHDVVWTGEWEEDPGPYSRNRLTWDRIRKTGSISLFPSRANCCPCPLSRCLPHYREPFKASLSIPVCFKKKEPPPLISP